MANGTTEDVGAGDALDLRSDFGEIAEAYAGLTDSPTATTGTDAEDAPTSGAASDATASRDDGATDATTASEESDQPDESAPDGESETQDAVPADEPFTYTFKGEAKPVEGMAVIPGHGAIVDLDTLPKLQQRLSEADFTREQASQFRTQLADWTARIQYRTDDGRQLQGPDAYQASRLEAQMANAVNKVLWNAVFSGDPQRLVQLATDPAQLEILRRDAQLAAINGMQEANAAWGRAAHEAQQSTQSSQTTQQVIASTAQWLAQSEFGTLPAPVAQQVAEDFQQFAGSIVRDPRTPEERQIAASDPVLPGKVVDLAAMRAAYQRAAQRVQQAAATGKAQSFNAPVQQQNGRKVQPGQKPKPNPAHRDTPAEPGTYKEARDDWKKALRNELDGVHF